MDLLSELREKQLGATIAVTGYGLGPEIRGMADVTLELGSDTSLVPDALRPPLDVIFGQLLGLFCSLEAGLKPDTPSPSGAISRVVSHVKIHPPAARRADPVSEIK
jgi:tagatose-6-phosphate ketose/aldose isomerase